MADNSAAFALNFKNVFHDFLQDAYGGASEMASPLSLLEQQMAKKFDEVANVELTRNLVKTVQRRARPDMYSAMERALRQSIIHKQALRDELGLSAFIDTHFDIQPIHKVIAVPQEDFIFSKINHGFWEQLYSVFSEKVIPERMRIRDSKRYAEMYVMSDFVRPLTALLRSQYGSEGAVNATSRVHFALSLHNGMYLHDEVVDRVDAPNHSLVVPGAAIGAAAFFAPFLDGQKILANDGAFAKLGWLSGQLESMLNDLQKVSHECVFVVPQHLQKIRLAVSELPQSVLPVSGTLVHEGWLASLYSLSFEILHRLSNGRNLLVFTQSGVFSALLGLFLAHAKKALRITSSRLYFFDLGQVLDIANTEESGPWKTNYGIQSDGLFVLSK